MASVLFGSRAISQFVFVLSLGLSFQTVFAETESSTFQPDQVLSGELDPTLAAKGWVLLTKRNVPPTEFSASDSDVISIATNSSNALIYRELDNRGLSREDSPALTWQWRVDLIDEGVGEGKDPDWPVAIYAAFEVDKKYINWWRRWVNKLTFSAAGLPGNGKILTYIWSARDSAGVAYPNPYIPEIGQIFELRGADAEFGAWLTEQRVLFADFEAAFGHPAERILFLAISADGEDTATVSLARVRDLRLE